MINDAFGVQGGMEPEKYFDEAPNEEARRFYDQLEEYGRPLCEGSPHSALSIAVRLMNIKSDWNVPNAAMDSMVDLLGELVNPEFNIPKNFYQAKHLVSKLGLTRNRPNRNDEGDIDPLFPSISFFNQNGQGSKKCGKRGFTNMKMQSAVTHILLNCPEIQPYVKFNDEYSSVQHLQLVKEVALGHESQVLTMNKYCVNGFKFQTEDVSRNKKTNNSDVYIQGDVDGTSQTIEYYGVIHEIIEVRYSERINHDTHLFVVSFGAADPRHYYPNYHRPVGASSTLHALPARSYDDLPLQVIRRTQPLSAGTPSLTYTSPQLSAMRIGDSSSEQSDAMTDTPPLTQCFVHPDVSPSSTTRPSATPDDEMPALAPGQKNILGRVMIEPDRSLWHLAKDASQVIMTTFERRASARLSSWLKKVRDSPERSDWMLPHVFDELGLYWNTGKFKAISEQAKKARGSLKGGSLHTEGAKTVGTITREMEKELGRIPIEPEVFKKTHVRKKENESDPDVWVEERAE
ncbi:hypothetical protein MTR67_051653 [Solanum verrucosum]|uniref:Uncharacterized protein n=1 Tax=Solanum verrucosum TaxID=315347 RepID=A0AAF0V3P8_SOLVR|nr:hypothetical protein MTR67_051653 [Solanum verrucosum]